MGDRPTSPGTRHATLPGGQVLDVRPVGRADVDGLAELYAGLSADDHYLRFFSAYTPDRAFFERVASVAARGGAGLVAEVTSPSGVARLVAEAGYELLPDGDGEVAIAVAGGWRGWLGPFLLDALLELADARGVPNLEADILLSNSTMLALVQSRGYATLANDDWCTMRALLGTGSRTPSWPPACERPRVLVEVAGARWHAGVAADAAGLQVVACPGPASRRVRCPALEGRRCPLVDGADVVVVSRMRQPGQAAALLDAHRRDAPDVPVCVESSAAMADEHTPAGAPLVPAGEGDEAVVRFVERLARSHGRRH